jgi:hypothetical protein
MRDWFAAEVKDLVERTKKAVDEARLKELTGGAAAEEEVKPKKPRKGKQRKVEESEDDELPKAAPSKITPPGQEDLGELEARLGRLKDKERELTGQMDGGRKVDMKKTLIVEFSIENVQVRPSPFHPPGRSPQLADHFILILAACRSSSVASIGRRGSRGRSASATTSRMDRARGSRTSAGGRRMHQRRSRRRHRNRQRTPRRSDSATSSVASGR